MTVTRRQTISLCLVVKDEELFLRECLESARHVVDECVVVDTGSGDRSVAIARAAGARVFQEPWPGDLALAHDLPLTRASGDWVLTLDGDELLDPERGGELRDLVQTTPHDGFIFTVRNYRFVPGLQHHSVVATDPLVRGARSWTPSTNVRLFRNRVGFRHEGRVHQTVLGAMRRAGADVSRSDVPIHHYGFLRTDRVKSPLYTALAEQQTRDHPGDAKGWLELGMVHLTSRRFDDALASLERACTLGSEPEGHCLAGITLLAKRLPQSAVERLRLAAGSVRSLRYFVDEADIWQSLGEAYADLDDHIAAEECLRTSLRLRPDSPEAEGRLVAALAGQGLADEAARVARQLTDRYPGLANAWEAAGVQAFLAGALHIAEDDFRRAVDIEPERSSSRFNLALVFDRQGRSREARTMLARASESDRDGRLAGNLAGAVRRRARVDRFRVLGPRGVVSVIPHLCGGAAFVATELARALGPAHPQIIGTLDAGDLTGEAHREELASIGVPVVAVKDAAEMHALLAWSRPGVVIHHWWHNPVLDVLVRQGSERLVLRSASPLPVPSGYDRYVTLSEFQEQYQRHVPVHCRQRIPNGVDLERFGAAQPDEDLWADFNRAQVRPVRIAMVSRLDPDKFVRRLADYLAPLKDLPVVVAVAGRGARRWEIEPELARHGFSGWIRFLGPLPQPRVAGFLAAADIGLHLTETHQESHSLTVLQMMASGLPVVGQPRGCLPEMVLPGDTGFLAMSEAEVAAALRRLILEPMLRARLGAAARRHVEPFSVLHFARRWRQLVATVLETPSSSSSDGGSRRVAAGEGSPPG